MPMPPAIYFEPYEFKIFNRFLKFMLHFYFTKEELYRSQGSYNDCISQLIGLTSGDSVANDLNLKKDALKNKKPKISEKSFNVFCENSCDAIESLSETDKATFQDFEKHIRKRFAILKGKSFELISEYLIDTGWFAHSKCGREWCILIYRISASSNVMGLVYDIRTKSLTKCDVCLNENNRLVLISTDKDIDMAFSLSIYYDISLNSLFSSICKGDITIFEDEHSMILKQTRKKINFYSMILEKRFIIYRGIDNALECLKKTYNPTVDHFVERPLYYDIFPIDGLDTPDDYYYYINYMIETHREFKIFLSMNEALQDGRLII